MTLISVVSRSLLALLAAPLIAAHAAPTAEPDLARYRHASACVAVLKQDASALADRYHEGATAVKPDVVRLTEQGFAFVGTAYKDGLRNPQADQLLQEAEHWLNGQPTSAQRQLSSDCQAEGSKLLSRSNVLERALVSNRARSRVDKLLAPPKTE